MKTVQQHKNNSHMFQHLCWSGTLTADMGFGWLSKPWRELPQNSKENLEFLKSYKPENVEHLRILVHGPVGAGKSSFINSVNSVFKGRVGGGAAVDAISSGSSFTQTYMTYKIRKDPEGSYSFVFNDTMGFERPAGCGVHVEDIILALKGHVKEGYKFKPKEPLTEGTFYNPSPTLDDRVHVLVSVVPADKLSIMSEEGLKKLREVRRAASEMGIPQLAILTKIDEACPKAKESIKDTYWSKFLKEQADKCSSLLGVPLNCIFLVKNYHSETRINDDINALVLVALRQMVSFGEDFLKNLQD